MFGYQAKPSRELATVLEAGSITDSCNQCCSRNRTDSFDLAEAPAGLAVAEDFAYPAIVGCNSPIQFNQFLPQLAGERTDELTEVVIAACDDLGEAPSSLGDVPRDDDSMIGKETAHLVHQLNPIRY